MGNDLDAEGLADEFKADTTAANAKYAGGDVSVAGTVVFAGESHGGDPMVILGRFSGGVSVLFRKDHASKVKEIASGARVRITGRCRKKDPVESNLIIENAVLADPSAGAAVEEPTLVSPGPRKKAAGKNLPKSSSKPAPKPKSKK